MAITIQTPPAAFVQFTDKDYEHCTYGTVRATLPVYDENDIAFQFVLITDTKSEADELSVPNTNPVAVGVKVDSVITDFSEAPQRFRLDDTHILYYWPHGLPDFESLIDIGQCFQMVVIASASGYGNYFFYSNQFERISDYDACLTSVIEFDNDDNAFGYNYCADIAGSITGPGSGGGVVIDPDTPGACVPTVIEFTNATALQLPYTAALKDMYGLVPTVEIWIYDESGELVRSNVEVILDYPVTEIKINFGGVATGVVIIK